MRILFATTRGGGHLGPLLPLARACLRARHEVRIAGPPAVRGAVERAGVTFAPVAAAPDRDVAAAFAPVWRREADAAHVVGDLFIRMHGRAALPGMLALMESWRPDVVVRETMEFASTVAAERLGVPQVRFGVHLMAALDGNVGPLALAAGPLQELRELAGLERDESLRALLGSPLLTLAPAALDAPGAPPVERFRDPDAAAPGPRNGHRPLVFVAFGSEAPGSHLFPGLYRDALEALAAVDADVLVAVGDRRAPEELGPAPANARVERWVPQAEVLRTASAMVGHGGSGSTLAALSAGVPQVLVPLFVDGPANAARVVGLGAGLAVGGADAVPGELAAAVEAVLGDPAYRAGAAALAGEIAALPPIDDAVALLQSL
ncbi:MAG TPA: glycosyltransferase [Solirubrobacteraceae bacterium]|nr:glycosyltransferase [Solirubrobacteraceae bacterium]